MPGVLSDNDTRAYDRERVRKPGAECLRVPPLPRLRSTLLVKWPSTSHQEPALLNTLWRFMPQDKWSILSNELTGFGTWYLHEAPRGRRLRCV